ncbi:TetR/AcrR family transcriptional regulator [Anaerocolumna sp. AGMB13020]|uniref:TetR/AcrR family transcriptional regulator n=1 Tax=Anaerocolumna sp. AGMB13020 TaxID=3081750 RepID=UPI002955536D|nr:TetR/AcrR family transcriptional regulator [Anaerocolumna sp. AGMB13020]WOO37616.1 TetR/AcrR family transcriptional regulator [Anaerocolumna sp. AGMB13020]
MTEIILRSNQLKFHKDTFEKTTEDRRQKVLEVAVDAFALNGYNATSINDIAKNAEISIGAMYSYFASKEDLFLTIINNAYFLMEEILNEVRKSSRDIYDCVERMLAASREFSLKYPKLNQLYLDLTTQALAPLSVRLSSKLERITPRMLCDFIEAGIEAGIVSNKIDKRVLAYCIDNIFMVYQFSLSSDYYKERLKIFIGEENVSELEGVEKSIVRFVRAALEEK